MTLRMRCLHWTNYQQFTRSDCFFAVARPDKGKNYSTMKGFYGSILFFVFLLCVFFGCDESMKIADDIITSEQITEDINEPIDTEPEPVVYEQSEDTVSEKEYVNFGGIIAERIKLEGEYFTVFQNKFSEISIIDGTITFYALTDAYGRPSNLRINDPLNILYEGQWKEGEWLAMIYTSLDFDVYSNRTTEIFLSGPSPYIAGWWIDPRPVHEGRYQYLAALFDIPVEILLNGPSDKRQEPTDEWLVSLLNEDFPDVIKVSPDKR